MPRPDSLPSFCLVMLSMAWHCVKSAAPGLISIRGGVATQALPVSLAAAFPTWTFLPDSSSLSRVEDSAVEGWVPCTGFEKLFLPSDLPLPLALPALGVCVANGVPRYLMPSVVLTLTTPERSWRNRGVNSLPRSRAWIDVLGPFCPRLESLRLSAFGLSTGELRFLEDQDGAAAWESLFVADRPGSLTTLRPAPPSALDIDSSLQSLKSFMRENLDCPLFQGYHFVDIPLPSAPRLRVPARRMKMYLSDIDAPQRLLEYADSLDSEPLGELEVDMVPTSAGGSSEFLPEVYRDLYDPGNLVFDDGML